MRRMYFRILLTVTFIVLLGSMGFSKSSPQESSQGPHLFFGTSSFPILKKAMLSTVRPRPLSDSFGCCPPFTGPIGCDSVDDGRFFVIFYCYCVDLSGNVYFVVCP